MTPTIPNPYDPKFVEECANAIYDYSLKETFPSFNYAVKIVLDRLSANHLLFDPTSVPSGDAAELYRRWWNNWTPAIKKEVIESVQIHGYNTGHVSESYQLCMIELFEVLEVQGSQEG